MPLRLSVIGQSGPIPDPLRSVAYAVGHAIGAAGAHLYTGGRDGVMAAACEGAQAAGGLTIGILPGDDPSQANPFVAVPITTGLTLEGRSEVLIHAADCFLIVGGGAGTLAEVAVAYLYAKPMIALRGAGGWGDLLESILFEGRFLDHRRLVPVEFVDDASEAVALAVRLATEYRGRRGGTPTTGSALGDVPSAIR